MSIKTVGELRRALNVFSDSAPIQGEAGLTLSRIKNVGDPEELVILFEQTQAPFDAEFRQANPNLLVGFLRSDD